MSQPGGTPVLDALDVHWMQQALALARQGQYSTRPNPAVGCVLVREGLCVGQGFHPQAGQPHAEVFALREAGVQARGATAYVTLEPCAHFGRTPPCADALIAAGVGRVVMATLDANPLVAGQGRARLEAAGIPTTVGVCEAEARALNAGFLKVMAGGLPYVRLKIAASLDGRTAMASGESKWITGTAARLDVQHWRALSGAIITGSGTVLADDPALTVRQLPSGAAPADIPAPLRVVLDRRGRVPAQARVMQDGGPTLLVGPGPGEALPPAVQQMDWPGAGLAGVLQQLRDQHQVRDVLVECGSELAGAFVQAGLVDELIVYLAPCLLGPEGRAMLALSVPQLSERVQLAWLDVQPVGADLRLRLRPMQDQGSNG